LPRRALETQGLRAATRQKRENARALPARFLLFSDTEESLMQCNVSPLEAGLRSGIGMALLSSPLLNLHTYPLSLFGIVLIATGVASYCPLYGLGRSLFSGGSRARTASRA
jgi:hypothetical protein